MTQIVTKIKIKASPEKVWAILADYGGVQNFSPGIRNSYYTSDEKQGVGSSRHCELIPMGSLDEQIIDWREGQGYTSAVVGSSGIPPFKKAEGTMTLTHNGDETLVTFTFDYALGFGVVGAFLNRVFLKKQFEKDLPHVLDGLKHYCETGEPVSQEVFKRVVTQAAATS